MSSLVIDDARSCGQGGPVNIASSTHELVNLLAQFAHMVQHAKQQPYYSSLQTSMMCLQSDGPATPLFRCTGMQGSRVRSSVGQHLEWLHSGGSFSSQPASSTCMQPATSLDAVWPRMEFHAPPCSPYAMNWFGASRTQIRPLEATMPLVLPGPAQEAMPAALPPLPCFQPGQLSQGVSPGQPLSLPPRDQAAPAHPLLCQLQRLSHPCTGQPPSIATRQHAAHVKRHTHHPHQTAGPEQCKQLEQANLMLTQEQQHGALVGPGPQQTNKLAMHVPPRTQFPSSQLGSSFMLGAWGPSRLHAPQEVGPDSSSPSLSRLLPGTSGSSGAGQFGSGASGAGRVLPLPQRPAAVLKRHKAAAGSSVLKLAQRALDAEGGARCRLESGSPAFSLDGEDTTPLISHRFSFPPPSPSPQEPNWPQLPAFHLTPLASPLAAPPQLPAPQALPTSAATTTHIAQATELARLPPAGLAAADDEANTAAAAAVPDSRTEAATAGALMGAPAETLPHFQPCHLPALSDTPAPFESGERPNHVSQRRQSQQPHQLSLQPTGSTTRSGRALGLSMGSMTESQGSGGGEVVVRPQAVGGTCIWGPSGQAAGTSSAATALEADQGGASSSSSSHDVVLQVWAETAALRWLHGLGAEGMQPGTQVLVQRELCPPPGSKVPSWPPKQAANSPQAAGTAVAEASAKPIAAWSSVLTWEADKEAFSSVALPPLPYPFPQLISVNPPARLLPPPGALLGHGDLPSHAGESEGHGAGSEDLRHVTFSLLVVCHHSSQAPVPGPQPLAPACDGNGCSQQGEVASALGRGAAAIASRASKAGGACTTTTCTTPTASHITPTWVAATLGSHSLPCQVTLLQCSPLTPLRSSPSHPRLLQEVVEVVARVSLPFNCHNHLPNTLWLQLWRQGLLVSSCPALLLPPSPYPAPSPQPTIPQMPARSPFAPPPASSSPAAAARFEANMPRFDFAAVHAESRVAAAAVGARAAAVKTRAAAVEVEAAAAVEARAAAAAAPTCQGQSCWAPLCPAAVGPAAVREVCNWAQCCVPGSNHLAPGSNLQPPASSPSGAVPTPTAAPGQGPGLCWHCPAAGAAPVAVAATLPPQPPYPQPIAGPQQATVSLGHPGPGVASGAAAALLPAHSLPHSLTRSHSHSHHSALSLPLLCSSSAAAGVRSRQLVSTGSTTTDQEALAWLAAVGVAPDADILTPVGGLHFTTTASIAPEDAQATATGSECSQGHSPSRSHSSPFDTQQRENSVEWQPGQAAPDRLPSSLTTAWQKTWQESPDNSKADRTACRRVGAGGEAGTMELTGSGHLASSCCGSREPRHSAGAGLAAARTTTTTTTATLNYLPGCNCPSSGCSSFPGREAGGGQQPRVDAWPAGPQTTVPGPACLAAAQLGGRGGWASEEGGEKVVVEEEEEEEGQEEDVLAMAGQWVDPAETLKLARAAAAAGLAVSGAAPSPAATLTATPSHSSRQPSRLIQPGLGLNSSAVLCDPAPALHTTAKACRPGGQLAVPPGVLPVPTPPPQPRSTGSCPGTASMPGKAPPMQVAAGVPCQPHPAAAASNCAASLAAGDVVIRVQLQQPHPLLGMASQLLLLDGACSASSSVQHVGQGRGTTPAALTSFLCELGCWCQWWSALAGGQVQGGRGAAGAAAAEGAESAGAEAAEVARSGWATRSLNVTEGGNQALTCDPDMGMQARMLSMALTVLQYSVRAGMRGLASLVTAQLRHPALAPALQAVLANSVVPAGPAEQTAGLSSCQGVGQQPGGAVHEASETARYTLGSWQEAAAKLLSPASNCVLDDGPCGQTSQLLDFQQHSTTHLPIPQHVPAPPPPPQQLQASPPPIAGSMVGLLPSPGSTQGSTSAHPPRPQQPAALLDVEGRTLLHLAALSADLDMVLDVLHWADDPPTLLPAAAAAAAASTSSSSSAVAVAVAAATEGSTTALGLPGCYRSNPLTSSRLDAICSGQCSNSSSSGGSSCRHQLSPLPCGSWASLDAHGMTPLHIVALLPDQGRLAAALLSSCPDALAAWHTCRGPLHLTPHQLLPSAAELLPAAPSTSQGSQGSQSSSRAASASHQQASAASQLASSRVASCSPTTPHEGVGALGAVPDTPLGPLSPCEWAEAGRLGSRQQQVGPPASTGGELKPMGPQGQPTQCTAPSMHPPPPPPPPPPPAICNHQAAPLGAPGLSWPHSPQPSGSGSSWASLAPACTPGLPWPLATQPSSLSVHLPRPSPAPHPNDSHRSSCCLSRQARSAVTHMHPVPGSPIRPSAGSDGLPPPSTASGLRSLTLPLDGPSSHSSHGPSDTPGSHSSSKSVRHSICSDDQTEACVHSPRRLGQPSTASPGQPAEAWGTSVMHSSAAARLAQFLHQHQAHEQLLYRQQEEGQPWLREWEEDPQGQLGEQGRGGRQAGPAGLQPGPGRAAGGPTQPIHPCPPFAPALDRSTLQIAGQGIGMGSCTPPAVTLPPHSSAKGLFRRRRRALAAAGGQQEQHHVSARFAVGPQACCFAVVAGLVAWLAAHPHAVNATGLVWLLLGLALGTLFHSV